MLRSTPQALKRGHILSGLAARVNSCSSLFVEGLEFSAKSEAAPFQSRFKLHYGDDPHLVDFYWIVVLELPSTWGVIRQSCSSEM